MAPMSWRIALSFLLAMRSSSFLPSIRRSKTTIRPALKSTARTRMPTSIKLRRKVHHLPPLRTMVRRCAGLDVHKESVVACARVIDDNGELQLSTQTFGTTMSDLLVLGDWLASHGVTLVGMESTGVFWKPVYMLLETEFECWLLNAQHLRNVPGRKTDVGDAAWIAQLVAHGLVRPSFVPPKEIRELREVTRYRKALIEERTREAQRLH